MDEYRQDFVCESEETFAALYDSLLDLAEDPTDEAALDAVFRTVHTLKANFAALGFEDERELAHALEDLLAEIRECRIAVTPEVMDLLFACVDEIERAIDGIAERGESTIEQGEAVAEIRTAIRDGEVRSRGGDTEDAGTGRTRTEDPSDGDAGGSEAEVDALQSVRRDVDRLDDLAEVTSNLEDTGTDLRLVPLRTVVDKFPRFVRDLARSQGKAVDFETSGTDVELDRTVLEEMSDPLIHLLRNAIDHGVEPPAEREAAGKPREATVRLRASRERDRVTIEIEDDGRGIDPDALRTKAVEAGVMSREAADGLDDEEAQRLVFHAGFSTSEEVTDVSGRGVGMDVVEDTVSRLDGEVSIDSTPGEGTAVGLSLPVTVAIVKVLFVESGEEEYGLPVEAVDEVRRIGDVRTVEGEEAITHQETVYPLVRLGEASNVPGRTENGDGMVVLASGSERTVAIHCDAVSRQEEVVVKPFEGVLGDIPGLSGAAILGEGDVVTVLDVGSL